MKETVTTTIAKQLIEMLENFNGSFQQSFMSFGHKNFSNGKSYRGVNPMILACTSLKRGYAYGLWGTYKQWAEKGFQVKKGEKATCVIFWKPISFKMEIKNEDNELMEIDKQTFVARLYPVFNIEQVEGDKNGILAEYKVNNDKRDEEAEKFFASTGINIQQGQRPCYHIEEDYVEMPPFESFTDKESFYGVMAHECIHATGSKSRLGRDFSGRFGDESYAFEELVAEIGAGILAGELGYQYKFSDNNLAYIQSWLKVLKNDNSAIITACSYAQKGVDYLIENKIQDI